MAEKQLITKEMVVDYLTEMHLLDLEHAEAMCSTHRELIRGEIIDVRVVAQRIIHAEEERLDVNDLPDSYYEDDDVSWEEDEDDDYIDDEDDDYFFWEDEE